MFDFLVSHTPLLYFTQSLWRDEAYSILLAERSLPTFFTVTFDPPFYYVLLHFWMKIFGNSEIATRSLSFLGFGLATAIVIFWAEKLFKQHWLSWFTPLFFFFNPMLLYYAFEVRAYGWYVFFATASMYTYMERKWTLYVAATVLGLYTHTYMVFVPFVEALHYLLTHRSAISFRHIPKLFKDPMVRSLTLTFLLFSPWLVKVLTEFTRLKESWYFPVDLQLVKSVFGNIFLGYEGTPWFLWRYTALVSLILVGTAVWALLPGKTRARNSLFFLLMIVPVAVIVGISFYKPLFVNRYVIPATIAEVFLLVFALETIHHPRLQKIMAAAVFLTIISFNLWYPNKHEKPDIRSTMKEVNVVMTKSDVIFADSPLVFFEAIYYSQNRSRVFFYNPGDGTFPWYVGDIIVSPRQIVTDLPPYPTRAFVVHQDGTFDVTYQAPISYQPKSTRK